MQFIYKAALSPLLVLLTPFSSVAGEVSESESLPHWTFSTEMVFPADQSLNRCEDGEVLADGRLIVTDAVSGLRLVEKDGSSRPFGNFSDAGYVHLDLEADSKANGVSFEPDRSHVLVADVHNGGIYRVNVETEATEKVYQHAYGVNSVIADSHGGIWFTQSARNKPGAGAAGLFKTVWTPAPEGALYYLSPEKEGESRQVRLLADGFLFTNGLVLDEAHRTLYVAETMGSRLWQYSADVENGTVTDRSLVAEVNYPDNLELDDEGRIWIASPIHTEVLVHDPSTKTTKSVFRVSTEESEALIKEIERHLKEGLPWAELMNPSLWSPAPGLLTGIILTPEGGPVYASTIGNALIRLDR